MTSKIHPSAEVQSPHVGEGTVVWQNTVVLAGATVGSECNLNCFCFVENDVHQTVTVVWRFVDGMTVVESTGPTPHSPTTGTLDPKHPIRVRQNRAEKGVFCGGECHRDWALHCGRECVGRGGAVVTKMFQTTWWSQAIPPEFFDGDEVRATWTTSEFAVGTSNGLDALTLALRALNVGPGDEVVMPANTFIATALAVSQLDAQPVLVDVCPDTALMDPAKLQDALGPSTKVVVPVHLYGQACGMTSISELAWDCGASIVEDNAQAQGASWDGKFTGSWGDVSATSFYPGKNLGALGDAGAVTTSQRHLAQKARELGNYGSLEKYNHSSKGANMRLDSASGLPPGEAAPFASLERNEAAAPLSRNAHRRGGNPPFGRTSHTCLPFIRCTTTKRRTGGSDACGVSTWSITPSACTSTKTRN